MIYDMKISLNYFFSLSLLLMSLLLLLLLTDVLIMTNSPMFRKRVSLELLLLLLLLLQPSARPAFWNMGSDFTVNTSLSLVATEPIVCPLHSDHVALTSSSHKHVENGIWKTAHGLT